VPSVTAGATPTQVWTKEPLLKPTARVEDVAVLMATPTGADSSSSRKIELLSPGPIHRGKHLTVAYKWVGRGEAGWFEVYLALASSGSCVEGPLLYSNFLDGEPWQVDYSVLPWHAGGRLEDLQVSVKAPPLPDRFRICVAAWGGGERVWEEFFFDWLP
jgi:hypothetical protein